MPRHKEVRCDAFGEDPLALFERWFDEARAAGVAQPEAMTLATVEPDGRPSARMVLMKGISDAGAVFFTDRESRKGRALGAHPRAALVFWWPAIQKQVRIEGQVNLLDDDESTAYFQSRPRGSQLSAWASAQSNVIGGREALQAARANVEARFEGVDPLPRPPRWGGYVVALERVEFWVGQPDRLHDRLVFHRSGPGRYIAERLAP
ncbi:MAG: pyridoxamine 5'-phosphate oxidase [Bradymonadia bacterium]